MVNFYIYYIKNGEITMDRVANYWKAEVYARLIIDGFYTMDDVPEEWKEQVQLKIDELS